MRHSLPALVAVAALSAGAAPSVAAPVRPAPTFSSASPPLPVGLVQGSWREEDPGKRARLTVYGGNAPLATTTWAASWQSAAFRVPERPQLVLNASLNGYYAHVTPDADTFAAKARWRFGSGRWSPWLTASVLINDAPYFYLVAGYVHLTMARPPSVRKGSTVTVELRLSGRMPADVSAIDSAIDVRAGDRAVSPF